MRILAIESSCDETSAAVVEDGIHVLSNVIASSTAMHKKYGGIVPEIAAREQLKCILPVIKEALQPLNKNSNNNSEFVNSTIRNSIDAIAVTIGPGLIGSLLVGVETAKTIAYVTGKPIIPVNHVLAHMYANFVQISVIPSAGEGSLANASSNKLRVRSESSLQGDSSTPPSADGSAQNDIQFPAISLVVSGGHTELYLMKSMNELTWLGGTLDDAAGEAFDKTARLLGFGTGGGLAIQEAAKKFAIGNSQFEITLPRPMMYDKTLNFSFSGLKTAILREWNKYKTSDSVIPAKAGIHQAKEGSPTGSGMTNNENNDLANAFAYEVQEAITDVLVAKTIHATELHEAKSILLSGGVAANIRLREKFNEQRRANNEERTVLAPPIQLCTDNAAYIGSYAFFHQKPVDWQSLSAIPDLSVEVMN